MAEVYSLAKARRREPAQEFRLPPKLILFFETFGLSTPKTFDRFLLKRSRRAGGTVVYILSGPTMIGLSPLTGIYPPSFKEARKWVAAIAERQGWTLRETTIREMHPRAYEQKRTGNEPQTMGACGCHLLLDRSDRD